MLQVKKILWPTDFSEPSYQALDTAAEVAEHFKAELICVHVMEPPPENSNWADASHLTIPLSVKEEHERLQQELKQFVAERIPGEVGSKIIVAVGKAADAICRVAEDETADLIITATHGLTGWRRMVFGSVAEHVVRDASCPVLTLKSVSVREEKEE